MRKLSILFAILTVSFANAQQVQQEQNKTTTVVTSKASISKIYNLDIKKPKTLEQVIGKSKKTNSTAIYKSVEYPVYETAKGKLFIVYLNSKGNYSKKYITD